MVSITKYIKNLALVTVTCIAAMVSDFYSSCCSFSLSLLYLVNLERLLDLIMTLNYIAMIQISLSRCNLLKAIPIRREGYLYAGREIDTQVGKAIRREGYLYAERGHPYICIDFPLCVQTDPSVRTDFPLCV